MITRRYIYIFLFLLSMLLSAGKYLISYSNKFAKSELSVKTQDAAEETDGSDETESSGKDSGKEKESIDEETSINSEDEPICISIISLLTNKYPFGSLYCLPSVFKLQTPPPESKV